MFKVPSIVATSSSSQQPDSSSSMSGKRSWQDAFRQQDSAMARETMLGLSCGESTERPQQRPKAPQLTIFYAGAVNVYDNVPEDMVRALMILAAAKSSRPVQHTQANNNNNNNNSTSTSTSTAFAFPVLSSRPTQPDHRNSSSSSSKASSFKFQVLEQSLEEKSKATAASAPVVDVSNPKMQLLAGLPQARRASIQRFLEKRKQKQINNSSQDDEASVKPAFDEAPAAQFSMRGF